MYLIEIFIDKVTIFETEEDEKNATNKKLIIKVKFGPKFEFIIKENQLASNDVKQDDVVETDTQGRRKWTRTIRVGKSYLFPSYPDTLLMILSKFPLEIEVWNDDDTEVNIFVGVGNMHWQTEFFHMLKDTSDICKIHQPLSIKENTPLMAECCCKQAGEISFILRVSALGNSIITEFQQLMQNPDSFVFRTDKAPSMFECKRVEGDNPNFCMVGSLYETTTLEDPEILKNANQKIEICTHLQSCGTKEPGVDYTCGHTATVEEERQKKSYPIDKIRMGDIRGPCGNTNCPLAHKVKMYIRNLESYKREAGELSYKKENITRKICGACDCKDDRWHREDCPVKQNTNEINFSLSKAECPGCSGLTTAGETCEDKKQKFFGTGATPKSSKTQVNYVFSTVKFQNNKNGDVGNNFTVMNSTVKHNFQTGSNKKSPCFHVFPSNSERINLPMDVDNSLVNDKRSATIAGLRYMLETDVEDKDSKRNIPVYNCVVVRDDKDCSCNTPKPTPPCKTFDCECVTEMADEQSRKLHKPYCPSYIHKDNCPVTMVNEEETVKEDEEDEVEPLPYGLPPITLGPCPVMGRPCSVPDGFARMYKNAVLPTLPPSYSDAGKVCCSKEYERIKKALQEYMKFEKDHDFRCVNKFNVDTERRCCDKEQRLLSLMGKGCCGEHKLAIQEKFKEDKK
ncbi:unnamed protein product [Parnassius apollo]|uniref:(apollo) hypothetical protein n=1 Tax=Parnassius apollo TaxID=110799 RepID=A0A8S3X6B4_PARAO|nr:unnamed protein product [Parnassius apollo]